MAIDRNRPPLAAFVSHSVFPTVEDLEHIRARIREAKDRLSELQATFWSRFANLAEIRELKADMRNLGTAEVISREFVGASVDKIGELAPIEWQRLDENAKMERAATPLKDWLAARRAGQSSQGSARR